MNLGFWTGDNDMPVMSHGDSCGATYWKTSFSPAMWWKSPETLNKIKVSRNINHNQTELLKVSNR